MSKYIPLAGFLVLKPLIEESYAGMTISNNMSDKDSAGEVIAVGNPFIYHEGSQAIEVSCPVKVGDKVIFKNIVAQRYMDFGTGKHIYILKFHQDPNFSDIICKIEE